MQLQFTGDELQLVAQVLEHPSSARDERHAVKRYNLLEHVIAHDMRFAFDELEDLLDILIDYESGLRQQLAQIGDTKAPDAGSKSLKSVQHLMEKVAEACAMV